MTLISLISRKKSSARTKIVPIVECQEEDQQSPPRIARSPGKFWRLWSAGSNLSSPLSPQRKSPLKHRQFSDLIEDDEIGNGLNRLKSELPQDANPLEESKEHPNFCDPEDDLEATARMEHLELEPPVEFNVRATAIVSIDATRYPSPERTIDAKPCLLTLAKQEGVLDLDELIEEPKCQMKQMGSMA